MSSVNEPQGSYSNNPALAKQRTKNKTTFIKVFDTFRTLINLKYTPDIGLKQHLTTFNNLWNTIVELCSGANESDSDKFVWCMKLMTSSLMSKKDLLIHTLKHESLSWIVEIFICEDTITFDEVHEKLMAIAQAREVTGVVKSVIKSGREIAAGDRSRPQRSCCKTNEKTHVLKDRRKRKTAGKSTKGHPTNSNEISATISHPLPCSPPGATNYDRAWIGWGMED